MGMSVRWIKFVYSSSVVRLALFAYWSGRTSTHTQHPYSCGKNETKSEKMRKMTTKMTINSICVCGMACMENMRAIVSDRCEVRAALSTVRCNSAQVTSRVVMRCLGYLIKVRCRLFVYVVRTSCGEKSQSNYRETIVSHS